MKTSALLAPFAIAALASATQAAPLRSAEVTKVVNDVRLYAKQEEGRPANVGDNLTGGTSLHTGRRSRAELLFPDKTLSRIGANSVFNFRSGSRDMTIEQGSFLLQVPKNAGGATIRTATVTAAITGTTTMQEFSPNRWFKFITLEGTATLKLVNGKATKKVPPGHMLVMHPNAKNFPEPVVINIQKLVRTSALADPAVFGPLNQEADSLVQGTIQNQFVRRNNGDLLPTGLIVRGSTVRGGGGQDGTGTGDGGGGAGGSTTAIIREESSVIPHSIPSPEPPNDYPYEPPITP